MAPGPVVKKQGSPRATRIIAGSALVLIIVAVVFATTPSGCQRSNNQPVASATRGETNRILNAPAKGGTETVKIKGESFTLDLAADNPTRMKGLGGREEIPEHGGMLFIFPEPRGLKFVMRDCPVPIDVIFLDPLGYVTAVHAMPVEPSRKEGESPTDYENRLPRYGSRFAAQFAIELRGGKAAELGVKEGDKIDLDVNRLKKLAR